MAKNQAQRALINIEYEVYKPWVHAGALASGCAAFAAAPLVPPVISWGCIGAGFSFFWYWGRNNLTRTKRAKAKRGRGGAGQGHLIVNSASGSRKIRRFEYAAFQPGHINRETWGEMLRRWVGGERGPRPSATSANKPRWMSEFIFYGQYEGQEVQLLESDVIRFLNAAWRVEKRLHKGTGLSERRWVRNISQRPQWYKNLGTAWYYALIDLLYEVEDMSGRQLIVPVGWQQNALSRDPHQILEALKWAQAQKGNVKPDTAADALAIGTGGASNFES